jgi:molybdopterin-guanine dinucleotide biosynthesis protein A
MQSLHGHHLSDQVAGVILAGGKNTRMGGRDKAFLRVGSQPIVERTLALFTMAFPHVVVVSNDPVKYRAYPVEVVTDEIAGAGPLSGIHAGLGRVRQPYAFVAACDMPHLRTEPIAFLIGRLADHDAVVPVWEDDVEPLHALYATRLRSRIEEALRCGVRAIRDLLPTWNVAYVPEAELRRIPGAEESFRNVNTPEEAARYDIGDAVGP